MLEYLNIHRQCIFQKVKTNMRHYRACAPEIFFASPWLPLLDASDYQKHIAKKKPAKQFFPRCTPFEIATDALLKNK